MQATTSAASHLIHSQRTTPQTTPHTSVTSGSYESAHSGTQEVLANLKKIALDELSGQEKLDLQNLFEQVDVITKQKPADMSKLIFALTERFVQTHLLSPKPCANLLKYLSCEFQLKNQTKRLGLLSQENYKNTIRRSVSSRSVSNQSASSRSTSSAGIHTPVRGALASPHFMVSPVFTAHPTELNRPESTQELLNELPKVYSGELPAPEFAKQLWSKTGPRESKPTVMDEAGLMRPSLNNVLMSIHKAHKEIRKTLIDEEHPQIDKALISIGNWIGGDRDGNPNITPAMLTNIIKQISQSAFDTYTDKLGMHKDNKPGSLPNLLIRAGHGDQLNVLRNKLQATQQNLIHNQAGGVRYASPEEFSNHMNELSELDRSALPPELGKQLGNKFEQLKLLIDAIGFHGASTDIRQNSEINQKTVAALLDASGQPPGAYLSMEEPQRVQLLNKVLNDAPGYQLNRKATSNDPSIQKEIDFLDCYKKIQDQFGSKALKNIITANTETLSDMLEVCVMLKYAGLANGNALKMKVVPLIETVPDLKNANALVSALLETPWYIERVKNGDGVQQVMLGYSDSMRSDGITSAAWEVYKNTTSLQQIAEKHGIKMYAFHGRGGTEARGSGQTYQDEIQYLDGASLEQGLRQTEQGEEVSTKYGNRMLSNHNLSHMLSATLNKNSAGKDQLIEKYAPTMEMLSSSANEFYRAMYDNPELATFLKFTTPLEYVGLSNAGSRPASRKAGLEGKEYLAKLRAIPYTAAWYQSGSLAPAYFGLGTAMRTYRNTASNVAGDLSSDRAVQLMKMYNDWPFFKNLIDRSHSALQKADMTAAEHYANILPGGNKVIFNMLKAEYHNTREMIQLIKGARTLRDEPETPPQRLLAHGVQAALLRMKIEQPGIEISDEVMALSMQALSNAIGRFG